MRSMDELGEEIHTNSRIKGFWDHEYIVVRDPILGDVEGRIKNPSIEAEKIALIHTEASEALEAHRDNDIPHMEEELADVIIRVLDLAHYLGISMDRAVPTKMVKNQTREHLHGRSW